jgi:hypothetical protein
MTAVAACRSCGTELLDNGRFCHACGSAVAANDTHAEYKQVTVLFADVYLARETARRGDCDDAIPVMRAAFDHLFRERGLLGWSTIVTGVLVETLLDRAGEGDLAEAETAIERLAGTPSDDDAALRDIWLLRLRALLARARGEGVKYLDFVNRYRDMATSLAFEGHIAWAEAMP